MLHADTFHFYVIISNLNDLHIILNLLFNVNHHNKYHVQMFPKCSLVYLPLFGIDNDD